MLSREVSESKVTGDGTREGGQETSWEERQLPTFLESFAAPYTKLRFSTLCSSLLLKVTPNATSNPPPRAHMIISRPLYRQARPRTPRAIEELAHPHAARHVIGAERTDRIVPRLLQRGTLHVHEDAEPAVVGPTRTDAEVGAGAGGMRVSGFEAGVVG